MPNKKLVLHIGSNKTGSGTIQQFLANNRRALAKRGFCFPSGGATVQGNHSRMARDLQRFCNGFIPQAESWNAFMEEARSADQHTVVVSGEAFWTFGANSEPFRLLQEGISSLFDEVDIVCYLRRQDEYLRSCYAQGLRSGRSSLSFDDYVEAAANGGKRWSYDYARNLKHWADSFGVPHLIIRPFEPVQLHRDGLLADFASTCGIDTKRLKMRVRDQNVSPGKRVMAGMAYAQRMLPEINGTGPEAALLSSLCSNMSNELAGKWKDEKFFGFGPGQASRFYEKFSTGNAVVARNYLSREDGRLFLNEAFREEKEQTNINLSKREMRDVERRVSKIAKKIAR
jgi:hypothetical protein